MVPTRLRSSPSLYQPEQPDPQAQQGQRDLPDPVDLRVQMGLTALTVQLDLPDLRGYAHALRTSLRELVDDSRPLRVCVKCTCVVLVCVR